MAYELIETIEVGAGGAASIEFTGIPDDGTDLCILLSANTNYDTTPSGDYYKIVINSDTGANYNQKFLWADGSGVGTFTNAGTNYARGGYIDTDNTTPFGSAKIYISNYASSSAKSISHDTVSEANQTKAYSTLVAGNWTGTSAITSLAISPVQGSLFKQYSTASLYKITAGDSGQLAQPKATGGTVSLSGGYWYHTFTSSGTFTPTESLTADVLVVAGGGGGGNGDGGAGGGAGGYQAFASQSVIATPYSVTVGAGGTGAATTSVTGGNGTNSQFDVLTASVGGGGGGNSNFTYSGASGGSGGGAGTTGSGGSGTAGQGNAGGDGYNGSPWANGGGGGASAAGTDGTLTTAGNGGNGSTWLNGVTYAGGGGGGIFSTSIAGGTGGTGGGSNGTNRNASPTNATANTGGGGGGPGQFTGTPANGGSGVVIVRYAA